MRGSSISGSGIKDSFYIECNNVYIDSNSKMEFSKTTNTTIFSKDNFVMYG